MEIDFLLLADSAQVQGGKLYLLGGGWSFVNVKAFPASHPMAIAVGILVDWNETNTPHGFHIVITDEDGHKKLVEMEGQFEHGRPPGMPPGTSQRTMLAANINLPLERPGTYEAVATVAGDHTKRTVFHVVKAGP